MELRATLLGNHARNARARAPYPNLARNSPRSVFDTAQKRCNSNNHILKFERFTWELRATLLGNHARNARAPARNARNARARTPYPNLARNFPRSVFNTARKRCNSNDRILSV